MIRRDDPGRAAAVRALREAAQALFGASDDDAVMVHELRCTEPGCPPLETVVALLRSGQPPRQVKVHKAVVDVTVDDLRVVIEGGGVHPPHVHHEPETVRVADVAGLSRLYSDPVSVTVWERSLDAGLATWLEGLRETHPVDVVRAIDRRKESAESVLDVLAGRLAGPWFEAWRSDVAMVVGLCADLFESDVVGVRLSTVTAHCQRFHVDRITARLMTTYAGAGTEWVDHGSAVRSLLGHAEVEGDPNLAIVPNPSAIQRMRAGDVGVFKGDAWPGREGRGVVHRSPPFPAGGAPRLLLTVEPLER